MAPPVRAPGPVSALGGLPRSPGVVVAQAPSLVTPPSAVSGITIIDPPDLAVSMSGTTATLTWSASQSGLVSDYDVYRRSPATGVPFVVGVDTPVATAVSSPYVDSGLAAGDYEWEVFGNIGAWNPSVLPGLVAWYDASDAASITSSGGAVSQWNDKSGSGFHLVQATGAKQPATGATTINGLNVLDFVRANSQTMAKTSISTTVTSVFIVMKYTSTTGTQAVVATNASTFFYQVFANGLLNMFAGAAIQTSNDWTTGTAFDAYAIVNGASSVINLNGTSATGNAGTTTAATSLIVGDDTGTSYIDGSIGELFISSQVISGADLTSATSYLSTKWGTP